MCTYRIVVCPETLLNLLLEPGWDSDFENVQSHSGRLDVLRQQIESKKVTVYVPSVLVAFLHWKIRLKRNRKVELAAKKVDWLLENTSCNLKVDYHRVLKRSNSAIHVLGGIELYEVMCLVYAEELKVDAFVTQRPDDFQRIMDNNSVFADFKISIVDLEGFMNAQNA